MAKERRVRRQAISQSSNPIDQFGIHRPLGIREFSMFIYYVDQFLPKVHSIPLWQFGHRIRAEMIQKLFKSRLRQVSHVFNKFSDLSYIAFCLSNRQLCVGGHLLQVFTMGDTISPVVRNSLSPCWLSR